jgi:hypothetical protein
MIVTLKLITIGHKIDIIINNDIKLSNYRSVINNTVYDYFNIRNYNIIKAGPPSGEENSPIDESSNKLLKELFGNDLAFYIKPL